MRFESGGRQTGRTTKMLEWLQDDSWPHERRVILTFSLGEANRLRSLLPEEYHDQVLYPNELQRLRGHSDTVVAIDNVDHVLSALIPAPIDYATYTGP